MEIIGYLEQAVADGASDLFVVAGGPVSEKLDGIFSPSDRSGCWRQKQKN